MRITYFGYRVYLYKLNCNILNIEPNPIIMDCITRGRSCIREMTDYEKEVVRLLDEFTLLNCVDENINIDTLINNVYSEIKASLIYVNKVGGVRKNKKKDSIYNFLFKNSGHLNDILLTHIVILILRTLQYSNFNTKINNKQDFINNNNCMLQKTISIVYDNLKIFLDFYSLCEPHNCKDDYEIHASIIFYIINIMSHTKCGTFNAVEIKKKKIIKVEGVCTINILTTKYKIYKSVWSDINIYSSEFFIKNINKIDYLCPPLFLYSTNIIKQKYYKPASEYTNDFKQTVLLMANTKIYICFHMLGELKKLVDCELITLRVNEDVLLKKFKKNVDRYNNYKLVNNIEVCDF